jgi:2',3'-cyclic-nucleotide 2'-phosphodiesterase (5'-nucleotidase family)
MANLIGALTAAEDEVCVLHAGDALTGTIFYSFFGPEPDGLVMNAMGFDAFVVGNHEFDDGDAVLADFIQILDMPVLSHNGTLIFMIVRCFRSRILIFKSSHNDAFFVPCPVQSPTCRNV